MIGETAAVIAAAKTKESSILGLFYKDLAQPSVQKMGAALGDVFQFCTTPIMLLKFGTEIAQLNFKKHLDNYQKKIESVPEEEQIPVNPQIGIPVLDRLTYTTNDEVANLFINLLSKATSTNTVNLAHPAFIQIIDRLSVDEARIINYFIGKDFIPCISYRAYYSKSDGFIHVLKNATLISFELELLFPDNLPMYLNNLESLGILDISHGYLKADEAIYEPLKQKHNYDGYKKAFLEREEFKDFTVDLSYFQITDFGKSFVKSCTLLEV